MSKKYSGWGLYPKIKATKITQNSTEQLFNNLNKINKSNLSTIPRGLGRSYGDSSLSNNIIDTTNLNQFTSFDPNTGILSCMAGTSLDDILKYLVPKGWFIPVTPGTKYVTIGGAIASDVHGKNHHIHGSFSEFILNLKLLTAAGEIISCSKQENPEIFYATCGGMGLTGIILEATIQLTPIKSSYIKQTVIKTETLDELINKLDEYNSTTYSVAWIDCLNIKKQSNYLKGLLLLGEEFPDDSNLKDIHKPSKITIPFSLPFTFINKYSMKFYNSLHYMKSTKGSLETKLHYDQFFYPLDNIQNWNYLYGSKGFLQYQFVIPKNKESSINLQNIFYFIKENNIYPFLVVLKKFGKANDNYLSFPEEGYTVTFDFKVDNKIFSVLDILDKKVLEYGGKIYLTKDARMKKEVFQNSYKNIDKFLAVKNKLDPNCIFKSEQYKRLFD